MIEEGDKDDDWYRYAEQPEKNTATHDYLLLKPLTKRRRPD